MSDTDVKLILRFEDIWIDVKIVECREAILKSLDVFRKLYAFVIKH